MESTWEESYEAAFPSFSLCLYFPRVRAADLRSGPFLFAESAQWEWRLHRGLAEHGFSDTGGAAALDHAARNHHSPSRAGIPLRHSLANERHRRHVGKLRRGQGAGTDPAEAYRGDSSRA